MVTPTLAQRLRVLRVIWVSQLVGVLAFAGVALAIGGRDPVPAGIDVGMVRSVLTAVAVALALLSVWWRRTLGGRAAAALLPDSPPEAVAQAFARTQAHCVIVWALCEGVGVIGLVLALLSGGATVGVPFFAAAVLLMVANRPGAWPLEAFRCHGVPPTTVSERPRS